MDKFVNAIAEAIIPCKEREKTHHMVMLFFPPSDLGIESEKPFVNTRNICFDDITAALNCYANTRCPASQLISASSEEELMALKNEMIRNFRDEAWLEENIFPFL